MTTKNQSKQPSLISSKTLKFFKLRRHFGYSVNAIREAFHPNAYLRNIKNVRCGLEARTKILVAMEIENFSATKIAKESGLHYGVVMHHLRLLRNEGTVERKGIRRYLWFPTGLGQKRLG